MAFLLPLIAGAVIQNMQNKGAAQQNSNANAGSVANASTAWNNAFRRMAPWLKPGAGPFGGMSVAGVGAPNYGTPYGSPPGGPGPSPSGVMGTAGGGAGGMGGGQLQNIIQMILARMHAGGPQTGFGPAPQPSPQPVPAGGGHSPVMTGTPITQPSPMQFPSMAGAIARYMPQQRAA